MFQIIDMIIKILKHSIGFILWIVSHLFRNKSSLFLFGSDSTEKNSNTFYLFKEMKKCGFKCYWVYKGDKIDFNNFEKCETVKFGSLHHIYLTLNASIFFITHTIYDVALCKSYGVTVINLWHGIPIKLLGYDSKVFIEKNSFKFKLGFKPEFYKWDFFCCSTIFFKNVLSDAFNIDKNRMLITGSAKNHHVDRSELIISPLLSDFSSIILYAPTYRPWTSSYLNFLGSKELDDYLTLNNCCLLFKLHPYEFNRPVDFDFSPNIKDANVLFPDFSIEDLYSISSVLVTDFSSALFDFSLSGRPFIIYAEDFDFYESKIGGSYINLKIDFKDVFCSDIETLIKNLHLVSNSGNDLPDKISHYISRDVEYNSIDLIVNELNKLKVINLEFLK